MKFNTAISALIDQTHANRVRHHIAIPGSESPETRDETATGSENIRIAAIVGRHLVDDTFYGNIGDLDFGTFDNGREYGLTITVNGWVFAVYEHRNSDNICINGAPVADDCGAYGGEDKWDVLYETHWRNYEPVAEAMAELIRRVRNVPSTGREKLKQVVREGVRAAR